MGDIQSGDQRLLISYQSMAKREGRQRLRMEAELSVLENTYCQSKYKDTLDSILGIKYEYNCILGEQFQNHICKLKQKYY